MIISKGYIYEIAVEKSLHVHCQNSPVAKFIVIKSIIAFGCCIGPPAYVA